MAQLLAGSVGLLGRHDVEDFHGHYIRHRGGVGGGGGRPPPPRPEGPAGAQVGGRSRARWHACHARLRLAASQCATLYNAVRAVSDGIVRVGGPWAHWRCPPGDGGWSAPPRSCPPPQAADPCVCLQLAARRGLCIAGGVERRGAVTGWMAAGQGEAPGWQEHRRPALSQPSPPPPLAPHPQSPLHPLDELGCLGRDPHRQHTQGAMPAGRSHVTSTCCCC